MMHFASQNKRKTFWENVPAFKKEKVKEIIYYHHYKDIKEQLYKIKLTK